MVWENSFLQKCMQHAIPEYNFHHDFLLPRQLERDDCTARLGTQTNTNAVGLDKRDVQYNGPAYQGTCSRILS